MNEFSSFSSRKKKVKASEALLHTELRSECNRRGDVTYNRSGVAAVSRPKGIAVGEADRYAIIGTKSIPDTFLIFSRRTIHVELKGPATPIRKGQKEWAETTFVKTGVDTWILRMKADRTYEYYLFNIMGKNDPLEAVTIEEALDDILSIPAWR